MVVPPEDDEQDPLPGLMVGVVKTSSEVNFPFFICCRRRPYSRTIIFPDIQEIEHSFVLVDVG